MSNFKDISSLCIDEIKNYFKERLTAKEGKPAEQLAEAYLNKIQPKNLVKAPTAEVCGEMMSMWRFIKHRDPGKTSVRVYNPSPEEHQWYSTHSIIEIICDDQPFLIASILMELDKQDIEVYDENHIVYTYQRDQQGILLALEEIKTVEHENIEFLMHIEIERQPGEKELSNIESSIWRVLNDVGIVCKDWKSMSDKLLEVVGICRKINTQHKKDDIKSFISQENYDESLKFLEWLVTGKFLFIGYAYYSLQNIEQKHAFVYQQGSGLGLLEESRNQDQKEIFYPNSRQIKHIQEATLLVLTKSEILSTIHRPGHLDHIGVKHYKRGNVIGEWRFYGLLSSVAYSEPIEKMPLVRKKIQQITNDLLSSDEHRNRILRFIVNQYPRDELLQSNVVYLKKTLSSIVSKQERRQFSLFLRTDSCGQFVTAIVYTLKERYSTELRLQFEQVLLEMFDGKSVDFNIVTTDHPFTQVLFRVYCDGDFDHEIDVEVLEARLSELMMGWQDRQKNALVEQLGEAQGKQMHRKYIRAFPAAYREDSHPLQGVIDIESFESLSEQRSIVTRLYYPVDTPEQLHFRVIGSGEAISLSDVIPILEQMGVRVISARPYKIKPKGNTDYWISDFAIQPGASCDLEDKQAREIFQEVFTKTWANELENDGFNALALNAKLNWRCITLVRALSRYLLQLQIPFSQHYMQVAVNNNPRITSDIISLFFMRLSPDEMDNRERMVSDKILAIENKFEQVASLDEDRILRHYLSLVQVILRTNFFQTDSKSNPKPYVSIKLSPQLLSIAPQPRLKYEIFVYSPRIEGIHMRAGKVARGGLRWSDRKEDYRTEILGLAKAQMVKNSVIVPLGAKGGFVAKQLPVKGDRKEIMAEGIACYRMFISGLLDITDNMQNGAVISPKSVVCHDENDPYLVVAADKGTATFSDIANEVSHQYKFWLGDAFASGGSLGYDHKLMGITAKGAWESVKRLFWTKEINVQTQDFTVVGIGDMSGDVFGNGMLISKNTCLVAAFNHMHIFIDPTPDPLISYNERLRLFKMERSSWGDYNKSLLSKGGNIYSRTSKSIRLSQEAKKALGAEKITLTPNELIQIILRAPVDLLWNGGIGTYIKASFQTNEEVGDLSNDCLRIDATEVRASVIGEGGNLGLTQQARIELSRHGKLINTDAVDNSAGVDCSDHEVNIKILLDQVVADGDLTVKQRNNLLTEMTDEVGSLVIRNNYLQTLGLTITTAQSSQVFYDHRRFLGLLESEKRLKRKLEVMPSDAELSVMLKNGKGFTRPEIAVLLAHSKLKLFDDLIADNIEDDDYLSGLLPEYFPKAIKTSMADRIKMHPLRAEILATYLSNEICNRMGEGFMYRIQRENHCSSLDVLRAFIIVKKVFNLDQLWRGLESLEYIVDATTICHELYQIRRQVEKSIHWLIKRYIKDLNIQELADRYSSGIQTLDQQLPEFLGENDKQKWHCQKEFLLDGGVHPEKARSLCNLRYLYFGLGIVNIANTNKRKVEETARIYFLLEEHLELHWLREKVRSLPEIDLWQRKARDTLRDRLDKTLSDNCIHVLKSNILQPMEALEHWLTNRKKQVDLWKRTIGDLQAATDINLAMLSVAIQDLSALARI